jgi:predicted dehydrogenase
VTLGAEEEISRLRFCFAGLTVESHLDPYNPGRAPWRFLTGDAGLKSRIDQALAGYEPGPERWTGQFVRLHGALTEGTTLPVTVADARASIELITAAYHSAATGETVRLPIGPDHPAYAGWRR